MDEMEREPEAAEATGALEAFEKSRGKGEIPKLDYGTYETASFPDEGNARADDEGR